MVLVVRWFVGLVIGIRETAVCRSSGASESSASSKTCAIPSVVDPASSSSAVARTISGCNVLRTNRSNSSRTSGSPERARANVAAKCGRRACPYHFVYASIDQDKGLVS